MRLGGDYDGDGFLDLFVDNGYPDAPGGGDDSDRIYRNNGDATFTRMTTTQVGPILDTDYFSFGCRWIDYNNDGKLDLFVAVGPSYDSPAKTRLFENLGDGTFRRVTTGSLDTEPASALAWGDYDNDGYLDAFAANGFLSSPAVPAHLHRNVGGTTFTNVTAEAAIVLGSSAQSAAWGDYDNDGWLDLFVCDWAADNILLHNNADGTFTPVHVGSPIVDGIQHFAASWVDYNNDGSLDLFVSCGYGARERNLLYKNNPGSNGWLEVRLVGTASNKAGIGAKVRLLASIGGRTFSQVREIASAGAWSADQGLRAHFGLGDATNVTTLRIEWPSGIIQELQDVATNQFLTVVESQGYTNAAPQFSGATKDASGSQLSFTEPAAGARYILEASTNLVTWTKLLARTSIGVTNNYTDTRATNYPSRFYRLQVP